MKTKAPSAKKIRCNADKSSGKCRRTAGWGTDHLGTGRCLDHDILPARVTRELALPQRIHTLAAEFKKDRDPFDLSDEIAMTRAAVALLLEDHEVLGSFLKAVPALNSLLNTIGRLVTRLDEIERGRRYVIRIEQVALSLRQVTAIVVQFVDDPEARAEVAKQIGSISIDGEVLAPPTEIPVKDQELITVVTGQEPAER